MWLNSLRFTCFARPFGIFIASFRSTKVKVHASMTGAMRRAIAPFLWPSLLGLKPGGNPDEDILLLAALLLNELQVRRRAINMHKIFLYRTSAMIEQILEVPFKSDVSASEAVWCPVSTKLNKMMYHARKSLQYYGCSSIGDIEYNGGLHKSTKESYNATNKHYWDIVSQILSIRTMADLKDHCAKES